ncbi:MAG TPA: hypothetical protein VID73_01580 [Ktedonobacterales bacterium]|jgi:hypothetical protein
MDRPAQLLARLDAIGASLAASGHALALLGLGSVGADLARLDAYSDLDFFAIVEPGHQDAYIRNLGWLAAAHPIAYAFQNTRDGYKVLFADGIFAEFAVFAPADLARIPAEAGRIVWQVAGFALPAERPPRPAPDPLRTPEWLLGEALTNLYVGLCRWQRGEKLSAMRFIQVQALDCLLEWVATTDAPALVATDPFTPTRRFERRYPEAARHLPALLRGYEGSVASARAMLAFIEARVAVNGAIKQRILELCAPEPR